jgi:hypothetical protein
MSPHMSTSAEEPSPAFQTGRKTLWVGIVLAALGVVVLGMVAVFLFFGARDYARNRLGQRPGRGLSSLKDFSNANAVSVVLGEQEAGQGVIHMATERDGLTEIATLSGKRCRKFNLPPATDGAGRPRGYFYFALDPSFKQADARSVKVEVEYFSESKAFLGLQYDANASPRSLRTFYTRTGPAICLDGAKLWETATFHIRDGAFENSQNGGADFRLEVRPPELGVRRVTVTRESQED